MIDTVGNINPPEHHLIDSRCAGVAVVGGGGGDGEGGD